MHPDTDTETDFLNLEGRPVSWERATIEKLLLSELRERRARRRWAMLRTLLWMLIWGALIWFMVADRVLDSLYGSGSESRPHTAMVTIRGVIAGQGEASAAQVLPALANALEDKQSRALVLVINSPGGSPVQAGMITDEIRRLRAKHDKPIYAVVEETCASAAYYIASAADQIFVDKASIVGSIGVLMDGFGLTGAMDKLGVERRLITAGSNKGFMDPFSPLDERQLAHAQQMLDEIHQQFITEVRTGRGDRLKGGDDTFSGLVWTGQKAVELGLADGLGNLDHVAREVVQAEEVVDYSRRDNVAERLARRLGVEAALAGLKALSAWQQQPQLR